MHVITKHGMSELQEFLHGFTNFSNLSSLVLYHIKHDNMTWDEYD